MNLEEFRDQIIAIDVRFSEKEQKWVATLTADAKVTVGYVVRQQLNGEFQNTHELCPPFFDTKTFIGLGENPVIAMNDVLSKAMPEMAAAKVALEQAKTEYDTLGYFPL